MSAPPASQPALPWRCPGAALALGALVSQAGGLDVSAAAPPSPAPGSRVPEGTHVGAWTKGGGHRTERAFSTPLGMARNSTRMNYFWNFPFTVFRLQVTAGNQNHVKQNLG